MTTPAQRTPRTAVEVVEVVNDPEYGWRVEQRRDGSISRMNCSSEREANALSASVLAGDRCLECDGLVIGLKQWMKSVDEALRARQLCHKCWCWTKRLDVVSDPARFVAEGRAYCIGPDDKRIPNDCRGYAGARAIVRFNDGRTVETTNLWDEGEIPEWFRERLPDTAVLEWQPHRFATELPAARQRRGKA